jgi:hypothetical protein
MLEQLDLESCCAFWRGCSMTMEGRELSGAELVEYIWEPGAPLPIPQVPRIMSRIEPFLVDRGLSALRFMRRALREPATRSVFIAPRIAIHAFEPIRELLAGYDDPRTGFLEQVEPFNDRLHPGTFMRTLSIDEHAGHRDALILHGAHLPPGAAPPPLDGELFIVTAVLHLPAMYEMAPFDGYEMIAETQDVATRLGAQVEWSVHRGKVWIEGEVYGRTMPFSAFLADRGIAAAAGLEGIDPVVTVMQRHYYCPRRQRVYLHRGCAYGAPAYLYTLRYTPAGTMAASLQSLAEKVLEDPDGTRCFHERSRSLVEALRSSCLRFRFDENNAKLYCNESLLFRGVPARIMHHLLGRLNRSVELKELMADHRIFPNPRRDHSITVRLQRIEAKLRVACPGLKLRWGEGSGTVELVTRGSGVRIVS